MCGRLEGTTHSVHHKCRVAEEAMTMIPRKRTDLTHKKDKPGRAKESDPGKPEVIVDFVFDDGLFFISVNNIGAKPAIKVSVTFDKKIKGLHGHQDISALPLFKTIEFLAPHKEILTFLDTSASYFRRGEPTKISATILFQDTKGKTYRTSITHDLEIYKEIAYIRRSRGPTSIAATNPKKP